MHPWPDHIPEYHFPTLFRLRFHHSDSIPMLSFTRRRPVHRSRPRRFKVLPKWHRSSVDLRSRHYQPIPRHRCMSPCTFMVVRCARLLGYRFLFYSTFTIRVYFIFTMVHYICHTTWQFKRVFLPHVSELRKLPLPFVPLQPSYFDLDLDVLDIPFLISLV